MRTVKIAAVIVACAVQAYGASTVTASRDYVDRKTTLHPYSNEVKQVGYVLGTQTNKVLASKEYVDDSMSSSSPGDYLNVSNKAYGAYNEIGNRLSSVAAYPKWESGKQSAGGYVVGEIVSHSGLLYRCTAGTSGTSTPDIYANAWTITTIGKLIEGNIPGDYSTVSNAAVNARSATDLGVRGLPVDGNSWFVINGARLDNTVASRWGGGNFFIDRIGDNQYLFGAPDIMDTVFALESDFTAMVEGYQITGYTNTLAQVSQIPTVPPGIVTTNEAGTIKSSIAIWNVDKENTPHDTTLRIGGNRDPFGVSNMIVVAGSYYGGSIFLQHGGPNGSDIVISASGDDGGINDPFPAEISVGGTNILPIVFGAVQEDAVDAKISTNNEAFVLAVRAVPLVGADPNDLSELSEYGTYGTVGAALLALIAGLAALKRRIGTAETAINGKANAVDLPYALVTRTPGPDLWSFSGNVQSGVAYSVSIESDGGSGYNYTLLGNGDYLDQTNRSTDAETEIEFSASGITASRPSTNAAALLDRSVNAVSVTGATTLTLPALVTGRSRDTLVRITVSADSAVTFSAPYGETITWDDAGSPTATYEAGTHLLRFTEVEQGVFHFTDLGDGGSIDPAVLNGKLEATSAAPTFDPTKTYSEGEHVTYNGVLYECSTAVTTAGAWTGSTNWTATDMTSPDATLDLMADGRLRLVSADGEVLWMQGYGLAFASSVTLSCDKANFHAFAAAPAFDATASYAANDIVAYDGVVYVFTSAHSAGAWTGSDASVYAVELAMPTAPSGKVGDFVLDVDNTANASASVTATLTGAGTAFDVFTPEGVNLSTDILTFAGGEQCELYFTMTAFGTAAKPAWKVVKQVVEKQEFGS